MSGKTGHTFTCRKNKCSNSGGKLEPRLYEPVNVQAIEPSYYTKKSGSFKRKQFREGKSEFKGDRTKYWLWLKYLRLAAELHDQGIWIRKSFKGQESRFFEVPDPRAGNPLLNPDTTFGTVGFDKWFQEHHEVFAERKVKLERAMDAFMENPVKEGFFVDPNLRLEPQLKALAEEHAKQREGMTGYKSTAQMKLTGRFNYHTACNVFNSVFYRLGGMSTVDIGGHPLTRPVNKRQSDHYKENRRALPAESYGTHSNNSTVNGWLSKGTSAIFGVCFGSFYCSKWEEVEALSKEAEERG